MGTKPGTRSCASPDSLFSTGRGLFRPLSHLTRMREVPRNATTICAIFNGLRWVVERSVAGLTCCRRLAKDDKRLPPDRGGAASGRLRYADAGAHGQVAARPTCITPSQASLTTFLPRVQSWTIIVTEVSVGSEMPASRNPFRSYSRRAGYWRSTDRLTARNPFQNLLLARGAPE